MNPAPTAAQMIHPWHWARFRSHVRHAAAPAPGPGKLRARGSGRSAPRTWWEVVAEHGGTSWWGNPTLVSTNPRDAEDGYELIVGGNFDM